MPPTVSRSARASSISGLQLLAVTTLLATSTPISRRSAFAAPPAATIAAVWRALARSRAFRTSSRPYFMTPARSAWPGRGSVTASLPLPVRLALGRPRAHAPRPVLVVAVADDERERRPQRAPVPEARRAPRPRRSRSAAAGCARSPAAAGGGPPRSRSRSSSEPGRQPRHDRRRAPARATPRRWSASASCAKDYDTGGRSMTCRSSAAEPRSSARTRAAPWPTSTSRPSTTRSHPRRARPRPAPSSRPSGR